MKFLFFITFILYTSSCFASDFQSLINSFLENDPAYQEIILNEEYQNSLFNYSKTKLFVPGLDLSHSYSKDEPTSSSTAIEYKLTKLQLSYNLFSFGSDYHQYKAAKFNLNFYRSNKTQTLIEREQKIVRLVLNYIYQRKNLDIQQNIMDLKKKLLNISLKRYKRGSLSINDLTKVQIDFSNAQSEYLNTKQDFIIIKSLVDAYNTKVGLKDFPWTQSFKSKGITTLLEKQVSLDSIAELNKYKQIQFAHEHDAKKEFRRHYGSVSFNYSRSLVQYEDQEDQYGWSTSLVYTLPIFENYSRKLKVDQANAKARVAKIAYYYQKRLLDSQLNQYKKKLSFAFKNFKNRLKTLDASNKLLKSNARLFKKGRLSVNDLFIEQDRLFKTKFLTNKAIYDLHLSYLEYNHKLGLPFTTQTSIF